MVVHTEENSVQETQKRTREGFPHLYLPSYLILILALSFQPFSLNKPPGYTLWKSRLVLLEQEESPFPTQFKRHLGRLTFQSQHLDTLTRVFLGCLTEAVELVAVCSLLAISFLLPSTKRPKGVLALTYMGIASGCGQWRGQEIACLVLLLC